MTRDLRSAAIGLAGFCAFVNLYAPQSLLPLFAQEFDATPADAGLAITATVVAIAATAPFAGALADVLGRKRVIAGALLLVVVPMAMICFAPTLQTLVLWRFVQGLILPPLLTVTVAYIGEEWPPAESTRVTGVFISAAGLGGFSGRFLSGLFADTIGWRPGFLVLAAITLIGAVVVAVFLPKERHFVRSDGLAASTRQMLAHLGNPRLIAIYAIGFGVLFNFLALFTYVSFHLAAAPFNLSPAYLGAIFVVYLAGSAVAPWLGRAVARYGRQRFILGVIGVWIAGAALTLAPSLPVIILGLAVAASCGFLCQAASTNYVALTAQTGRTSAIGLYSTAYYVGGGIGSVLPGLTWATLGWPGTIAMVIAMLCLMALIVCLTWAPRDA